MPWDASVGFSLTRTSLDIPLAAVLRPIVSFCARRKLVELARCAHPDLDRVGFDASVLRLPRVAGHSDGLIADVLDLVDRPLESR
jgi:hypothetical protein